MKARATTTKRSALSLKAAALAINAGAAVPSPNPLNLIIHMDNQNLSAPASAAAPAKTSGDASRHQYRPALGFFMMTASMVMTVYSYPAFATSGLSLIFSSRLQVSCSSSRRRWLGRARYG